MKIRTTQPKNNKYYIRTVSGGYNGAVAGQPTISGANVLCNCVGYANGRFNEIGEYGKCKYQLVCNAENFIEAAKKLGLKISSTPIQGGIMVWQKGKTLGGGDGAGHVAVVEEVYNDGSIMTSESGYGAWAFKTIRRTNSNRRWGQSSAYKFRGCIINPSIKNPKTVPVPPLVVDGVGGEATVRAMQRFFGTVQDGVITGQMKSQSKYYPALKSVQFGKGGSLCIRNMQKWLGVAQDGILGQNTIKALQYVIGVNNDGIMGAGTMRAWQKYLNTHDKAVYPSSNGTKITARAKEYAWAYGTSSSKYSYSKGSPKPAYKTALKKYMGKTGKVAQSDCGYFVSTCVRASGIDKNFLALKGVKESFPAVPSTFTVVHKGKKIPDGLLQAGDIIRYKKTSGQHCLMYYGDGKIAEAGRGSKFPVILKDTKKYNKSNVKLSTLQVLRAK